MNLSFWKVKTLTVTPNTNPNQINKTWYIGNKISNLIGQYIIGWKSPLPIFKNSSTGPENKVEAEPVTPKTINIITTWKKEVIPHFFFIFFEHYFILKFQ